jgi:hypothetical protein
MAFTPHYTLHITHYTSYLLDVKSYIIISFLFFFEPRDFKNATRVSLIWNMALMTNYEYTCNIYHRFRIIDPTNCNPTGICTGKLLCEDLPSRITTRVSLIGNTALMTNWEYGFNNELLINVYTLRRIWLPRHI